ncbi:pancreatic triacylglycerol lipase-like [Hyposmocoma kahamanoa]|uniref:pancreatic triacylglycerol lipase-like n=1 Tax=Hyposmocoma kahamanoa TaxID=1477025 RepID=UPI000E6D708F|nr:pancreatic triacylglycerol lipase-like [Hyposmocoma kahamanoa]
MYTIPPEHLKPVNLPSVQHSSPPVNNTGVQAVDFTVARYNPDRDNIYYVFTRSHPNTGYPLLLGVPSLLSQTDFDPRRRTVVLVHGWLGSVTDRSNIVLVPAFLNAEDVNVIVVDWNAGAGENYVTSVINTVISGEGVSRFITWLNRETGAFFSDYHIVGHSLGGHQAGIIGRNLNGSIPYITALDPAYPLWILNPHKFQANDGQYTEVIHTNAGVSGYLTPLGHVDFYPNGGINMAGCDGQNCDHDRCFHYMAESVKTGGFSGTECRTYAHAMLGACSLNGRLNMGGVKPKTGSRGVYFLRTNAQPPFSIN